MKKWQQRKQKDHGIPLKREEGSLFQRQDWNPVSSEPKTQGECYSFGRDIRW
jgi:hypothetical protein